MSKNCPDPRAAARERNRREMPNVADVIDQFTRFFGPVKVLGAEDYVTGKRVGTLPETEENGKI